MRFGVAILAAGASRRMGRCKLALPWDGGSVVARLLETWHQLGARQVALVVAPQDAALEAALEVPGVPPAERIVNPDSSRGMFSSVQCAAGWPGWEDDLTHVVLALGDQPHLRTETLLALIAAGSRHPSRICQPESGGRRRHPVLFPRERWRALSVSPGPTLADVLRGEPETPLPVPTGDPGIDLDLDTPADYRRALRLAGLDPPPAA